MTRSWIPLALLLSTAASAQTSSRPEIVRGLCQPDGCSEFAVVNVRAVATDGEGTLLRTRLKTFHSSQAGRKDVGEEDGFVYCSPVRPAILANQDGRTMAYFLAPFATAETRESIRRNANYHAVYFAICHGSEAGRAAVQDLPGVAESLGYRVPLAQSKIVTLNRAEDVMAGPVRGDGDMRREAALPPRDIPPVGSRREAVLLPPRDIPLAGSRREPLNRSGEAFVPPIARQPSVMEADRDEGWLAGPRRFTNRAFDALDEIGSWVFGR